jgi:SOS-response transcriptional repressor LexA
MVNTAVALKNPKKNSSEINIQCLAGRLKLARKTKNLSQIDLAGRLNCSQTDISRYESGERGAKNPDINLLIRLAKELGVTVEWLLTGKGHILQGNKLTSSSSHNDLRNWIPLIDWESIDSWLKEGRLDMVAVLRKVPVLDDKVHPLNFSVAVKDAAMHNPGGEESFKIGDVLIIDKNAEAKDGDLVVAKIDTLFPFYFFRKYTVSNEKTVLKALNPEFKDIVLDINHVIYGVVVDFMRSVRR